MGGLRHPNTLYSRQFHFKTCHNILYLNKILHRMQLVDNSKCSFCNIEDETIVHIFSQCSVTNDLWLQIKSYFSRFFSLPEVTPQSAFLVFLCVCVFLLFYHIMNSNFNICGKLSIPINMWVFNILK